MTNVLATLPELLTSIVKNNKSIVNCLITLQILGLERVSSNTIFQCPCYEGADAGNFYYGLTFLIAPAFVLLVVGYLINPSTARLLTGLKRRKRRFSSDRYRTLISILLRATIAPLAWLTIALLDGKYFACAVTSQPYSKPCEDFYNGLEMTPYSIEFQLNRTRSQIIGWGFVSVVFAVAAAVYSRRRYTSTMSLWRKKYVTMTKQIEQEQFEKLAAEKIKGDAEKNITKFMTSCPTKADYDVMTDLCFTEKSELYYSSPQKWCERQLAVSENDASNEADSIVTGSTAAPPVY